MAVPEAFLSAKRLGNVPGVDVDVVCLKPGPDIRSDASLDEYVARRFSHIERLQVPSSLRTLAGGNTSVIVQLPGFYHVLNLCFRSAAIKLLQGRHYDALVTWSQWHPVHLVGLALKKRFPNLPWIAHFSDPWADNPFANYDPVRRAYNRHREHKVYESADVLSLPSRESIDLIFVGPRAKYRGKAVEIPHAFDSALYPDASPPNGDKLIFRSLGAFYGARSPEPMLRALELLRHRDTVLFDKITVEFIGATPSHYLSSAALRRLPSDTVRFLPPVDYRTSLGLMRSADLLLNIDAPFADSPFLPSKLIDYIGAGRPIFGLTPPGAASRVIKDFGGWVSRPDDPQAIAEALAVAAHFIEENRGKNWGEPSRRNLYSSALVGARFGEIVDRAIAEAA
jgi:glycosyltransferase involved in cell wall biosynthesis